MKKRKDLIFDGKEINSAIVERILSIYFVVFVFLLHPFARLGLLGDLCYAARTGNLLLIRVLINAGCDVNACDEWGEPPLHYAISNGHVDAVQCLIEQGADKKNCDRMNRSALHAAVDYNQIKIVRYLIEKQGANKEERGNANRTPLHVAVCSDYTDIVRYLLKQGANIRSRDINHYTPAQYAKNPVVIELFREENHLREEIRRAAIEGDIACIENILREHPEKLEIVDSEKKTPLIHATIHARREVVDFLLKQGANPERIGDYYVGDERRGVIDNLIHFAKMSKDADFIKWIKDRVGLTKEYLRQIKKAFYNFLENELFDARKNGKKLIIVLGEFHQSYTLTQIEKRVLRVAKKLKIMTLFEEYSEAQSKILSLMPSTLSYFAKQKLKMNVVGVDNHPNKGTAFSGGAQGVEVRNEVIADGINTDGVLIVGVAHLKGLLNQGEFCSGLDAEKLHIVPFNLASIWQEKEPSYLFSDFYRNPEFVIQIRGESFSDQKKPIDNCNLIDSLKKLSLG